MPTKMATCCREKAVLVAVYVERPSKRTKPSSSNNIHHHHHRLHLHKHGGDHGSRGGYNRKAELLNYSRRLRDSAQSVPPSPHLDHHDHQNHHPKPTSSSSHNQKQSITQIMGVQSKPKHARGPACLGSWKILIPSFLNSFKMSQSKKEKKKKKIKKSTNATESTDTKAKATMKSFQGKKKEGFISKVFAVIQKYSGKYWTAFRKSWDA